ncbi:5-methyltetrahydropteroyltriglutamate--homocysteine S-methyltransferase [Microlunatus elymi]|uniref:5-methyltetrahydropteroyltriglutamate--homocysteine methyltransferase n=1 Tax=Microlunatus elymi TaxID=2596828 RepID=A0A516PZ14_9ACTN|nr:5-methyltetrahydropteroyltriglutamate--homocysteine S-methyltransferase [Microlunatus elymi]QDP96397.1 5-methyltetrahydropteroyltriglutamate--homocysteine S-methyltransferase [Microlunatus elymi]
MINKNSGISRSTILGYPRLGAERQLKKATEAYWAHKITAEDLLQVARQLRLDRWAEQRQAGLDELPSNDFSLYDQMLDAAWMLGAIPDRHRGHAGLDRYFAMARGTDEAEPLEMTKWFDTNYHYLVPELGPDTEFRLDPTKPLAEFDEALRAGYLTRPVIIGPVSFLLLSKPAWEGGDFQPLELLDRLVPLYAELLSRLAERGVEWVQVDEPCLVTNQPDSVLQQVDSVYRLLAAVRQRPKIIIASYFGRLGAALPVLAGTPIDGLALDLTGAGAANLDDLERLGGLPGRRLIAGVIDGRNIWAADLPRTFESAQRAARLAGEVAVAASCSLLHVPLDVTRDSGLAASYPGWFSFARQKLSEIVILARGLNEGAAAIAAELGASTDARQARLNSPLVVNPAVRRRAAAVGAADLDRGSGYPERRDEQRAQLGLPDVPTTTIGSFPQTRGLRRARAKLRCGELSPAAYDEVMRDEVRSVITEQEHLGLDVLVHGEPERNDMVQYFAEQLDGYVATEQGWVQSYGTRYVRPPILLGDVSRPAPMTVEWARFAQSLTDRPVKGMLTGPVTMLAWSFVRDDQPPAETARQVALALRDEVTDLEAAGIKIIQVDEPALRETLPLRAADRAEYLRWAVESFRLTVGGVANRTQIHTHMCYAEFGDVLDAIIAMDADVISLEAARSKMAIVADLAAAGYPNEVGPGVWDIHSPRVPDTDEIVDHLRTALAAFGDRVWANPDCGLKTRGYPEARSSLANLVAAAEQVRQDSAG